MCAARIFSNVTGSLSRRTCPTDFKSEAGLTDYRLARILWARFLECQKKVFGFEFSLFSFASRRRGRAPVQGQDCARVN
jgi:hypothetical protein